MTVHCNHCGEEFDEDEILLDTDKETELCPRCNKAGGLMDLFSELCGNEKLNVV